MEVDFFELSGNVSIFQAAAHNTLMAFRKTKPPFHDCFYKVKIGLKSLKGETKWSIVFAYPSFSKCKQSKHKN